jgi:hypothetical protein
VILDKSEEHSDKNRKYLHGNLENSEFLKLFFAIFQHSVAFTFICCRAGIITTENKLQYL